MHTSVPVAQQLTAGKELIVVDYVGREEMFYDPLKWSVPMTYILGGSR